MKLVSGKNKKVKVDKLKDFYDAMMSKIKEIDIKDLPELALNVFLGYKSVQRLGHYSFWFYGPLAYRLASTPSYDNTSVSIGLLGTTIELPSAQTVGIAMLAYLGLLDIISGFDFTPQNGGTLPEDYTAPDVSTGINIPGPTPPPVPTIDCNKVIQDYGKYFIRLQGESDSRFCNRIIAAMQLIR